MSSSDQLHIEGGVTSPVDAFSLINDVSEFLTDAAMGRYGRPLHVEIDVAIDYSRPTAKLDESLMSEQRGSEKAAEAANLLANAQYDAEDGDYNRALERAEKAVSLLDELTREVE